MVIGEEGLLVRVLVSNEQDTPRVIVLFALNGVQGLHRILLARDQGQGIRDFHRYLRFVKVQQATERESRSDGQCTKWPGWKHNVGTLTSTPSVIVLMRIDRYGHEQVW